MVDGVSICETGAHDTIVFRSELFHHHGTLGQKVGDVTDRPTGGVMPGKHEPTNLARCVGAESAIELRGEPPGAIFAHRSFGEPDW